MEKSPGALPRSQAGADEDMRGAVMSIGAGAWGREAGKAGRPERADQVGDMAAWKRDGAASMLNGVGRFAVTAFLPLRGRLRLFVAFRRTRLRSS